MTRPTQAIINLASLRNNYQIAKRLSSGRVFAVMKANAYGHGLLECATALSSADGFAVLELSEAVLLRKAGLKQPIVLIEGFFDKAELKDIDHYELGLFIHNHQQLQAIHLYRPKKRINIFIKINTGMNRLGFSPDDFKSISGELPKLGKKYRIFLATHFATADTEKGISGQLDKFNALTLALNYPKSTANSAAIIQHPSSYFEWSRAGIMLYGSSPFADISAESMGLKPVMTLKSRIIGVQHLKPGDSIGYGESYTATEDMRIAVVACGYADGYPRHAPNGTPVVVEGQKSCLVGRVSMDMLTIDITSIEEAGLGSEVELWGENNSIDVLAQYADTISYELMCNLNNRVDKIFLQTDSFRHQASSSDLR